MATIVSRYYDIKSSFNSILDILSLYTSVVVASATIPFNSILDIHNFKAEYKASGVIFVLSILFQIFSVGVRVRGVGEEVLELSILFQIFLCTTVVQLQEVRVELSILFQIFNKWLKIEQYYRLRRVFQFYFRYSLILLKMQYLSSSLRNIFQFYFRYSCQRFIIKNVIQSRKTFNSILDIRPRNCG